MVFAWLTNAQIAPQYYHWAISHLVTPGANLQVGARGTSPRWKWRQLRNELVDAFADVASDAQIAGFHASPLADCTVKTRYGSEMTPKKEAQMLAEWSGRNHEESGIILIMLSYVPFCTMETPAFCQPFFCEERSQGFATQCKHALAWDLTAEGGSVSGLGDGLFRQLRQFTTRHG